MHHRDAVSFQYLAFTWVHQGSLSVIQLALGGIRHDQFIVLMKAIGAIEVARVWNHPTSHRTLRVGPLEGRSAASPRLDHTLATPETNGSQPANEVKLFICDVIGDVVNCFITHNPRRTYEIWEYGLWGSSFGVNLSLVAAQNYGVWGSMDYKSYGL